MELGKTRKEIRIAYLEGMAESDVGVGLEHRR